MSIKALEDEIRSLEEWKTVCLAQSIEDEACHSAISFVSPLNILTQVGNNVDLSTASQAEIDIAFFSVLNDPIKWS